MISLKEHNDLVDKLCKQLSVKEAEIKGLEKQVNKIPKQAPQIEPTASEVILNKKILQINKEHKEKVAALTLQLTAKDVQIKDLNDRIVLLRNQELKEKEHVAEFIRKTQDKKPWNSHQHKIASLISHYEGQLANKNAEIQGLSKQIKSGKGHQVHSTQQDAQPDQEERSQRVPAAEQMQQLNKAKGQASRFQKLYEEKSKEYSQLSKRYEQLTNDYYKMLNDRGNDRQTSEVLGTATRFNTSNTLITNRQSSLQTTKSINRPQHALRNILSQLSIEPELDINSLVLPSKAQDAGKSKIFANEVNEEQVDSNAMKIIEIVGILGLSDPSEIVPRLFQMKAQQSQAQCGEEIIRYVQALLYRLGQGKAPRVDVIMALGELERKVISWREGRQLVDELCVLVGAKPERLQEKIDELKTIQQEYFSNMRKMKFVQQLPRASKIVQFVEYFQLDKQELELPEQLKNIYKQLKAVEKFAKEATIMLNCDQKEHGAQKGLEITLNSVLRFIQASLASKAGATKTALKQQ